MFIFQHIMYIQKNEEQFNFFFHTFSSYLNVTWTGKAGKKSHYNLGKYEYKIPSGHQLSEQ